MLRSTETQSSRRAMEEEHLPEDDGYQKPNAEGSECSEGEAAADSSKMISNRIDRNQIPSAIPTMREVNAIVASEDSPIAGTAIHWTELAAFCRTAMQPMLDSEVEGLKR